MDPGEGGWFGYEDMRTYPDNLLFPDWAMCWALTEVASPALVAIH